MKKSSFLLIAFLGFFGVSQAQTTWLQQITNATGIAWRSGKLGVGYLNTTTAPTFYGMMQITQALNVNSDDGTPIPSATPDFRFQRTWGAAAPWWHVSMVREDLNFSYGTGAASTTATNIFNLHPTAGITASKNLALANSSTLTLFGGSIGVRSTPTSTTNVFSVNNLGQVTSGNIQVSNGSTLAVGNTFSVNATGATTLTEINTAASSSDRLAIKSGSGAYMELYKTGTGASSGDISFVSRADDNISSSGDIKFWRYKGGNDWSPTMTIQANGKVSIGTENAPNKLNENAQEYLLYVKGGVLSQEVSVKLAEGSFPDYVFADDYKLMPLKEVEDYIKENKHLPNMPAGKEVEQNDMNMKQIILKQQEKIEELYLHIIELEKQMNQIKKQSSN